VRRIFLFSFILSNHTLYPVKSDIIVFEIILSSPFDSEAEIEEVRLGFSQLFLKHRRGMASLPNQDGLYPIVKLNYHGVFIRNPFSYINGVKATFTDHDFAGLTYAECVTWLETFIREDCKHLYYCEPDKSMVEGIRRIECDIDYTGFIFYAYGTDGSISLFVDHKGGGIENLFNGEDSDHDESGKEDSDIVEGDNGDLRDVHVDYTEAEVNMNITFNDEFLSKLCGQVEEEDNNDEQVDDGDVCQQRRQIHSIFNESLHWKKQKPILGLRFKDPGQL